MDAACIDYKDTGYFSQTVIDYLENVPELRSFYSYRPTLKGFAEQFDNKKVIANRDLLAEVLTEQYFGNSQKGEPELESADFIRKRIQLLKKPIPTRLLPAISLIYLPVRCILFIR
jgi:predicted SAM-dependent methyltransferase